MNWYLNTVLAATLGGVAMLYALGWFWEEPGDLKKQRRLDALLVRRRLAEKGMEALGHALALEIGGKDYNR